MRALTVVEGCTLTPAQVERQLRRAVALRPAVEHVERAPGELEVRFTEAADPALVVELVETERRCCSFLTIELDTSRRRVRIAADDPQRASDLDAFAALLGGGAWSER